MTFEEKFLRLTEPFFELIQLEDDVSEEHFTRFLEIDERIEPLKKGLKDLAKGDPKPFNDIVEFFGDENAAKFLAHPNAASLPKLLALASNITLETWSRELGADAPFHALFLNGGDRIEQTYDASDHPLTHYFYNNTAPSNSVAFIDFRGSPDLSGLEEPPFWSPEGQDFIEAWTIILLLQEIDAVEGCVAIVTSEDDTETAISYLKYHLVLSGNKLTSPVPLTPTSHVSDLQTVLQVRTNYTQFSEPFAMLSEVNSHKSILHTFLSTYHVLENYMIRSEVSSVLANTTNRRFQRVRDFKRLGQQTDASEVSHLTKLFRRCWETVIGSKTLSASLEEYYNATINDPVWNESEFDEFLVELSILNGNGNQVCFANGFNNYDSLRSNFTKLVYSIRCSIVHNKATEFHLSNEELRRKSIRTLVIEKLCLPVMQRLAFGLPSSDPQSNPIHYRRRDLMFY